MRTGISALLGALLLLGGCGSAARIRIAQPTTQTARVSRSISVVTPEKPSGSSLEGLQVETVGKDTVVTSLGTGQTFTFKDMTGFWGTLTCDDADLWIGKVRIRIDAERLRMESDDARLGLPLSGVEGGEHRGLVIRVSPGSISATPEQGASHAP